MVVSNIRSLSVAPLYSPLKTQETALSKTDWKVHSVAVLSYVLLAVGILLAFSSFYFATVFHPMIAMAFPVPVIGLALAGLQSGRPSKEVPSSFYSQASAPIGLKNKNLVNCWINAALQLLFNCPAYKKALENLIKKYNSPQKDAATIRAYATLYPFIRAFHTYLNEQQEGRVSSSVNTQELREWLYDLQFTSQKDKDLGLLPISTRGASAQEDTVEVVKCFLNALHPFKEEAETCISTLVHTKENGSKELSVHHLDGTTEDAMAYIPLHLSAYPTGSLSLQKLLSQEFLHPIITPGKIDQTHSFETPPPDLTLCIGRWTEENGTNKKASQALTGTLQLNVSKEEFGKESTYLLDGFTVHTGDLESGHYISILRIKDQWQLISDDSPVKILSPQEVEKYAQQAVTLHYQRSEKFIPSSSLWQWSANAVRMLLRSK